MAPGIGRTVRQRKLSPKHEMPILREGDLEPAEYKELIRIRDAESTYETGVEKSEENVSSSSLVASLLLGQEHMPDAMRHSHSAA